MQYKWTIRTSNQRYAGTDANCFLALQGTKGRLQEQKLDDPAHNDFEADSVAANIIESPIDLGDIQSGVLREDQSNPASAWSVDWVKIENVEDGRTWLANVGGVWSDHDGRQGRFPPLRFKLTDKGSYDLVQKQKEQEEQGQRDADDSQRREDELARRKREAEQRRRDAQQRIDDARANAELAKIEAEVRKIEAEAAAAAGGGVPPPPGGTIPQGFRTWEVIGRMQGQVRPLTEVIAQGAQGWYLLPGGVLSVGDAPTDGSGVAGMPGAWAQYAGGQGPEAFGLDPGRGVLAMARGNTGQTRPYPLTAQVLQSIFGAGWRQTVYGV